MVLPVGTLAVAELRSIGAILALAAALLLAPVAGGPVVDSSRPVLLGLGGLVVVHWITEKEERE